MTWNSDFGRPAAEKLGELLGKGVLVDILAFIAAAESPLERRQLFAMSQQTLARRREADRDLDLYIAVSRAGVDEGLRQAAAESVPGEAARRKDFANVLAFTLASDLAECWPGDLAQRTREHLTTGLASAREAVQWRDELNKPPAARGVALFVRGLHELSLGQAKDAAASFERSLDFARRAATQGPASVVPGGDYQVVLVSGCLGLATRTALFDDACTAFDATARDPNREIAQRAASGAAQLRWYHGRLTDPKRPRDLRY